jgi:hypothetical protein
MHFKIEYTSRRGEVWNFYWRAWRERLWKIHLTFVILAVGSVCLYANTQGTLSASTVLLALGLSFLSILWMPIYPQVMFKPQLRTLDISPDGLSTTIAARSGKRSWEDIQSVSDQGGYIVILGRNGNAFIVPPRAFASKEELQRFLSFAQSMVAGSSAHSC